MPALKKPNKKASSIRGRLSLVYTCKYKCKRRSHIESKRKEDKIRRRSGSVFPRWRKRLTVVAWFTSVKREHKRSCKCKKMKRFPFLVSALARAFVFALRQFTRVFSCVQPLHLRRTRDPGLTAKFIPLVTLCTLITVVAYNFARLTFKTKSVMRLLCYSLTFKCSVCGCWGISLSVNGGVL